MSVSYLCAACSFRTADEGEMVKHKWDHWSLWDTVDDFCYFLALPSGWLYFIGVILIAVWGYLGLAAAFFVLSLVVYVIEEVLGWR